MAAPRTPREALDRALPDLALEATPEGTFALRSRVGVGPLVLFFLVRLGTPG